MAASNSVDRRCETLYDALGEKSCHYCDGNLIVSEFKDETAVLCAECETPAVRTLAPTTTD